MLSPNARPALLQIDHPLCYSDKRPEISGTDGSWTGINGPTADMASKIQRLLDRQDIVNLLNEYAYVLDCVMLHPKYADKWAELFTTDCSVTYPFGTFKGRKSLPSMCLEAETRFQRMIHASSNFTITFESDTVAHARTNLFAVCGLDSVDIGKNFAEGGYYYWSFRKEQVASGNMEWKISYLFLDVTWSQGDSLGLNQPMPAADARQSKVVNDVKKAGSTNVMEVVGAMVD